MIKSQFFVTCIIYCVYCSAAYYSYWKPINCDDNGYGCEYSSVDNTSTTSGFETNDYYTKSKENEHVGNEARGFSSSNNHYDVNYSQYGNKKSITKNKSLESTFSKRVGDYVSHHAYANHQARQWINHAALTGNGLAFFAIIVGSIALALQQTRINDLQYQINRISTVTGTTFDMGNTATTVAFQSRIDSLESMVSSLQTQSTAATSNINALSADQTSICTQLKSALAISSAGAISTWMGSWNAIADPVCS